ncbi:ArsR/SmtB family transcription factor [Jeotgalibaca porci]|uniref:ArsR/SmtB family transcription factor n=1 Tax=Jeotgalibaca porci TaxID=1868793 RepID=UPI0035A07D71
MNNHVELFKLLGNEVRLGIAKALHEQGELTVTNLQEELSLPQATVSQHLTKMRHNKIVKARVDKQKRFYELVSNDAHQILDVLKEES